MTKSEVLTIINKPSYEEMHKLYNQYKSNNKHDAFFSSVKTAAQGSIHFNLLLDKCRQIYRMLINNGGFDAVSSTAVPVVNKPISTKEIRLGTRPVVDANPIVRLEDLPADLQQLFRENGTMKGEIKSLHALAKAMPASDKESKKVNMIKIAQLDDAIANNWKKIDKWWKENKGKPASAPTMTGAEAVKEIDRCKKYIGRNHTSDRPEIKAKVEACRLTLKKLGVTWEPKDK